MRRGRILLAAAATLAVTGRAVAHAGGIRSAAPESLTVPLWLFLAAGGGVVGASFLLASFVTDRSFVATLDRWRGPTLPVGRVGRLLGRLIGLAGLGLVLVGGFAGPTDPVRNVATLVVWVGWWGGVTLVAYLVANPWPAIDPFRGIAGVLPTFDRRYPAALGSWPAVVGLLALVYLEVVTGLAESPGTLAVVVVGYGLATVGGAVLFGDEWFARADPIARLMAAYGRIAPLARTNAGLTLRLPGGNPSDREPDDPHGETAERPSDRSPANDETHTDRTDGGRVRSAGRDAGFVRDSSDAAFVVAAVFGTTYDGFVGTGLWQSIARPLVFGGVPPSVVYLLALGIGYTGFLAVYFASISIGRRLADTFVSPETLVCRFTPPLLAIAAGYHLAHNLGTTLTLSPALAVAVTTPIGTPTPPTLVVPGWFGGVGIAGVLVGHLLAVWMAHTAAYELFPDRLQAVRSQYALTVVMIAYTMVSLWITTAPGGAPPYV